MPRPQTYIKLSPKERAEIESFMHAVVSREPPDWSARKRAQAIWYSSQGKSVQELSQKYKCSIRAIWSWFAAYQKQGVKGLLSRPISKRLSQLQRDKLRQMKRRTKVASPPRRAVRGRGGDPVGTLQTRLPGLAEAKPRAGRRERWTYPGLARWVKKNWGITISSRRLSQLLARYTTV